MKYLWTTVNVRDLDESIGFYAELTGLRILQRFPAGPGREIAFMGNGADNETTVELLMDSSNTAVDFSECISLGFAVESVDAMLETVKCKGIPVCAGPVETPSFTFFSIKDPNGLMIQFFQQK